jgi:hypothetical protein
MRSISSVTFVLPILWVTAAFAGKTDPKALKMDTAATPRYAEGSLGKVRASGANKEVIACSADSDGAVKCHATNADGSKSGSCTSNSAVFLPVVRMINKTSYLRFEWNASNQCTRIRVYDGSQYIP